MFFLWKKSWDFQKKKDDKPDWSKKGGEKKEEEKEDKDEKGDAKPEADKEDVSYHQTPSSRVEYPEVEPCGILESYYDLV